MFINIDGLNIEFTEKCEGIPVLLLHGWGSSFTFYNKIIEAMSDCCRMVAVNFPGCGQSDTMPEPWTIENYCDFVLKFNKAIGLENPILMAKED